MQKLQAGIHRFKAQNFDRTLFEQLAKGQRPETLFITCCDSRVVPNLITSTAPGELFIVRNVGNIVPSMQRGVIGGVAAAIEYAVEVLKVAQIVVCGHTQCGAIDAIMNPERVAHLPLTARWIAESKSIPPLIAERYAHLEGDALMNAAVEENVLLQIENLRTFDFVAEKLDAGKLSVSGWVYHIASGDIYDYDPKTEQFAPFAAAAP